MTVNPNAETTSKTPSIIEFLESRARLTGLVREIYIARGWIKRSSYAEEHYQVTPKGAQILQNSPNQKSAAQ